MKVFLRPTCGAVSESMNRVARALEAELPVGCSIVGSEREADFQLVHTIGPLQAPPPAKSYAVIQYCMKTAGRWDWQSYWRGARLVWSYYDLTRLMPADAKFMYAPLGVDGETFKLPSLEDRDFGVMTSGYVSGPQAEAIEEVARAADIAGVKTIHLGPQDVGMTFKPSPARWRPITGVSDAQLADLYGRSKWTSGLRRVEGFELPVVEGLACGSRPLVFAREETKYWFSGHAVMVPEVSQRDLVTELVVLLTGEPEPVTARERARVVKTFDWKAIAREFWRLLA